LTQYAANVMVLLQTFGPDPARAFSDEFDASKEAVAGPVPAISIGAWRLRHRDGPDKLRQGDSA
jgi:hypothetical protein